MRDRRPSAPFLRLALAAALAALAPVLVPPAQAQQQTGSLVVDVTDDAGRPIASAEVTLESDRTSTQLRGVDDRGRARFLLLPPGTYIVSVDAEGYTGTRREVPVALGTTSTQAFTLAKGELTETVEVTAAPDVDFSQTSTSDVYTAEEMQNVQIGSAGRSYLSVLGKSAGVAGGGGNPSVHGATIGENVYLIDGVNTTDPVTGTFGLLTNFDAIDQVELTTGGFQAEYGWATGGYVNQVTKSGTNEFHGTFDGRYFDERFIEDTAHFPGGSSQEFRQLAVTLGGPVVRDKAWFFLGYEDNVTKIAGLPPAATREFDGSSRLLKFTFQPHASHRIAIQYTADPAEISNDNQSVFVAPESGDFQKQGADFWKLTYWGRLTDAWALSLQAGLYHSVLDTTPLTDTGVPSVSDYFTGYLFNNYDDAQYSDRYNKQVSFSLERAWTGGTGDHDVKFGIERQDTKLDFERRTPGGERWETLGCGPDDPSTPEREEACLEPDSNGDGYPDNILSVERVTDAGSSKNPGENVAAFVQDSWHRGRFTLDYGLRWERARAERDDKTRVIDASLLQPRVGMSFDLRGDRKQKLYWSATRRMHPGILAVPSVTNTRNNLSDYSFNERYYGDLNGDGDDTDSLVFVGSSGGPSGSRVDEDLEATHLDEAIVGFERTLRQRHVLGTRLVLNRTKDIIEDTLDDPSLQTYVITNLPGLKRSYEGLDVEYSWRHRRGALFAKCTVARARGNVEYTQGIGSDFDYLPVHGVNRYGYLSTDRRVRLKVYGWVELPKKFVLAYDFFYGSGAPYERVAPVPNDPAQGLPGYGFEFLDKRGSHRLPALTTLDTDVKKRFTFGEKDDRVLTLIGTIHNVLGANAVTGRNQIDGPTWGAPTAYQAPRTYELGLRFEF